MSQGYNGFCTGCKDHITERYERPAKYFYTEHAERNALYNAARLGVSTKGCKIYTTLFPCADCARGIIQSGITRVITYRPDLEHHKYGESFRHSLIMFKEVGIKILYLD